MRKFLVIVSLNFFLLSYLEVFADMKGFAEKYGKFHREYQIKLNEKSLRCKKEIKDISGANAVEAYEKCMKRK